MAKKIVKLAAGSKATMPAASSDGKEKGRVKLCLDTREIYADNGEGENILMGSVGGSVTEVGLSSSTDTLVISGSPITTSGTIEIGLNPLNTIPTIEKMETIDSTLSSHTVSISANTDNITTISGNLNTVSGNLNTLSGGVSANTTAITAVSGDVVTLSGDVSTISGDVTTLQGEMGDKLDKGIADNILVDDVTFDATETTYTMNIKRYNTTAGTTTEEVKNIPIVTDSTIGVLPPSAFQQIQSNREAIEALQQQGGIFIGKSYDTYAEMEADAATELPLHNVGDFTFVQDDEQHESATTRYIIGTDTGGTKIWEFGYIINYDPVGIATTTTPGIVLSSEEDGKGFVETDGTISLVGYDQIKSDISGNTQMISANTSAITSNTQSIVTLSGEVTANTQHIATVSASTTANTQNISTLSEQVTANTEAISGKQDTLVSGSNIKTINTGSLLGNGDIELIAEVNGKGGSGVTLYAEDLQISSTDTTLIPNAIAEKQDELISGTNIKTINNQSILGSGNIEIQGGGGSLPPLPVKKDIYGIYGSGETMNYHRTLDLNNLTLYYEYKGYPLSGNIAIPNDSVPSNGSPYNTFYSGNTTSTTNIEIYTSYEIIENKLYLFQDYSTYFYLVDVETNTLVTSATTTLPTNYVQAKFGINSEEPNRWFVNPIGNGYEILIPSMDYISKITIVDNTLSFNWTYYTLGSKNGVPSYCVEDGIPYLYFTPSATSFKKVNMIDTSDVTELYSTIIQPSVSSTFKNINVQKDYMIWVDSDYNIHIYDKNLQSEIKKILNNYTQISYATKLYYCPEAGYFLFFYSDIWYVHNENDGAEIASYSTGLYDSGWETGFYKIPEKGVYVGFTTNGKINARRVFLFDYLNNRYATYSFNYTPKGIFISSTNQLCFNVSESVYRWDETNNNYTNVGVVATNYFNPYNFNSLNVTYMMGYGMRNLNRVQKQIVQQNYLISETGNLVKYESDAPRPAIRNGDGNTKYVWTDTSQLNRGVVAKVENIGQYNNLISDDKKIIFYIWGDENGYQSLLDIKNKGSYSMLHSIDYEKINNNEKEVFLTQESYDALTTKRDDTIYYVVDRNEVSAMPSLVNFISNKSYIEATSSFTDTITQANISVTNGYYTPSTERPTVIPSSYQIQMNFNNTTMQNGTIIKRYYANGYENDTYKRPSFSFSSGGSSYVHSFQNYFYKSGENSFRTALSGVGDDIFYEIRDFKESESLRAKDFITYTLQFSYVGKTPVINVVVYFDNNDFGFKIPYYVSNNFSLRDIVYYEPFSYGAYPNELQYFAVLDSNEDIHSLIKQVNLYYDSL
jgi:hypothetical protein